MIKRRHFRFNWYNIKNVPEDSYDKTWNKVYQTNKEKYFKKVLHIGWQKDINDSDTYYGIEWANTWNRTHLIFETPNNLYWIQFRDSFRSDEKGKWKFKIFKTTNTHDECG